MKRLYRLMVIAIVSIVIYQPSLKAGNIVAADLTYRHITGQTYEFVLTVFTECDPSVNIQNGYQVDFQSLSCASQGKFNVLLSTQTQISACGNTRTKCEGGTGLGFVKAVYKTNFTLPTEGGKVNTCTDWVFSWQDCNRSKDITNVISPDSKCLYLESTLNNKDFGSNNSPTFPNDPIAFLTSGAAASINPGTVESDGDRLEYSLILPRDKATAPLQYKSPFTFLSPISSNPAFALNAQTGVVNLTPSQQNERSVFAVLVKEFRNNILVGSVVRDLQIAVQSGVNNPPTLSGLSNTSRTDTTVIAGKPFTFRLFGSDLDKSQILTITKTVGSKGTLISAPGINPVGQFTWSPTDADAGVTTISFTIKDDACPQLSFERQIRITVNKNDGSANCNIKPFIITDTTCIGKKTKFQAIGIDKTKITSWSWSFGNGETSKLADPEVKSYYTAEGLYRVKLIVEQGKVCKDSSETLVRICAPAIAKFGILSYDKIDPTKVIETKCTNQNMEFVDSTKSSCITPSSRREWSIDNKVIGTGGRFIYKAPKSGNFSVKLKVYTDGNCLSEVTKTFNVNPSPKITSFADYDFKCSDLDTSVAIDATGGTPFNDINPNLKYKFKWKASEESVIFTPNDSVRAVSIKHPSDKTTFYNLFATDSKGCVGDTSLTIRNPLEVSFTTSIYCQSKDTIRFNATITSTNPLLTSGVWPIKSIAVNYGDGSAISNQLQSKHVYPTDAVYKSTVRIEDVTGCIRLLESTVFNILPDFAFGITEDSICYYESKTNYFGPKFADGIKAPIKYTWTIGKDSLDFVKQSGEYAPSNPKYRIPLYSGTKYINLNLDYNGGCLKRDSVALYVRPLPKVDITATGKCVPDPVVFDFKQSSGNSGIKTIDWQFLWRNAQGTIGLVDQSKDLKPTKTFTNHGTHFARISIVDSIGCINNQPDFVFRVEKMAKPCFEISGFCSNERLAFTKDCTSDLYQNIASIKWSFGDGTKDEFLFNPVHVYNKAGVYKVTCTMYNELDNKGCSTSSDTTFKIFPQPVASFNNDVQCFGVPIKFDGDSIPSSDPGDIISAYRWIFDSKDGKVDTVMGRNVKYSFRSNPADNSVLYLASYITTNSYNCSDTITKEISVYPKPIANFTYDFIDDQMQANKPLFFEGRYNASNPNTSSPNVVKWVYNFGDNSPLIESANGNVDYAYSTVAKYDVTLIAFTDKNCSDTITKALDLNAYLVVPNSITPNNDSKGDQFEIVSRGISKLNNYKIFNRWGQVVFDGNTDLKAKWDGTFNGVEQPVGVYVYYIDATTIYGEELPMKGNLTLIR